MRFYSRLVCICNFCFILAAFTWMFEKLKQLPIQNDTALLFRPLEATVVIIGYSAIILNTFFILGITIVWLSKRTNQVPRWIVLFNLLIFPVQVWYHFILH